MSKFIRCVCLWFIVSVVPAEAKNYPLIVQWSGGHITFAHADFVFFRGVKSIPEWRPTAETFTRPIVDCVYLKTRTKCIKTGPKPEDGDPYGSNLVFQKPIAIFIPENALFDLDWSSDAAVKEYSILEENIHDLKFVRSLPPYKVLIPTKKQLSEIPDYWTRLGPNTESHAYAPVDQAIGGKETLAMWRSLIGRLPRKECLPDSGYCSVVLNGSWRNRDVITYCGIMNSSIGLGVPFRCNIVAYKKGSDWWILSYDSPVQCDGCGAASGASCIFETPKSLTVATDIFIQAMKAGKTNIALSPIRKTADSITVVGRNVAKDSKFFEGYYDKSYASYKITKSMSEDGRPWIEVDGLFNLLISAEPSPDGVDYHDLGRKTVSDGSSDLEWFQEQVLKMISNSLGPKLGKTVECQVIAIE